MDTLFDSVRYLKGVGPKREKLLHRLGIRDIVDLLWHVPRYYFDRSQTVKINSLQVGEVNSISGRIQTVRSSLTSRGLAIIKAEIKDDSGTIQAVWFNQGYLKNVLKPGLPIFIRGKVNFNYGQQEISVYEFELQGEAGSGVPNINPVYPSTEGLSQKVWQKIVGNVLEEYAKNYPEIAPPGIKENLGLLPAETAFWEIHFPSSWERQELARRSLAFEELFLLQLAIRREQTILSSPDLKGIRNLERNDLIQRILAGLSFSLTGAQKRVVAEIFRDM